MPSCRLCFCPVFLFATLQLTTLLLLRKGASCRGKETVNARRGRIREIKRVRLAGNWGQGWMSRMEGNIFLSCKRGTQRIDDYRWFSACFFYSFSYIQSMPPNGLIKSTFLLRLSQRDRLAIPTFSKICSNFSNKMYMFIEFVQSPTHYVS